MIIVIFLFYCEGNTKFPTLNIILRSLTLFVIVPISIV